jgi:hypothetical protein
MIFKTYNIEDILLIVIFRSLRFRITVLSISEAIVRPETVIKCEVSRCTILINDSSFWSVLYQYLE